MKQAEILALFAYNDWANKLVLEAAGNLTPEQFLAPAPISQGSLRGALVHTYAVEALIRRRCQTELLPSPLAQEGDFPNLTALEARWNEERLAMRAYLEGLADADFDRIIEYKSLAGLPQRRRLWQMLMQIITHSTQTRSEASVILTQWGFSPGNTDLIYFFKE